MRLIVTTPAKMVVDADGVTAIRAEDATGAFGVLPGHTDLLTVLTPSVLSYRDKGGQERFVALRGGVLTVRDGRMVEVATREAFAGDDLDVLETELRQAVEAARDSEAVARTDAARLQTTAVRLVQRYLEASTGTASHWGER
jgi:F-type H+-transporting ATPase subunit epsilon